MIDSDGFCRSPTAHGVLDKMVKDKRLDGRLEVNSAGTGNFHLSESPDTRAIKAALARGYDHSRQRPRQIMSSLI